ncbi:MAG: hypothetical protein KKB51_11685 [Candidatus Riflebacteria bacterium]|nr:hypothetical protein [Candidatus Riflebacteria bacterium]
MYTEIESLIELKNALAEHEGEEISGFVFQCLDFEAETQLLSGKKISNCIFLGCKIPHVMLREVIENNAVFPELDVPYNPHLNCLYTHETLYDAYIPGKPESYAKTLDKVVYDHYIREGKEEANIKETLARRLHDYSITDALYDFLSGYDERKTAAIMGGHSLSRSSDDYRKVARISRHLTERGYLLLSGGGPGAMEATHLGAWMAGKDEASLTKAFEILEKAPSYKDALWLDSAFEVITAFPNPEFESLGIPTWLYGHEPPTPFATRIAKYFANSVREDGLLAVAKGGIVFSPGSAGTVQEVFQEVTQNHYLSFGYASPMVFFNKSFWETEMPIYPLLKTLLAEGKLKNLILSICSDESEVIHELAKFLNEQLAT